MTAGKRSVSSGKKIILAIAIPVFVLVIAFCSLGFYLQFYNDKIFPNVTIDGIDVSWLTADEANLVLDIKASDARGNRAKVTLAFPDGSELSVTGKDVRLTHDTELLVDAAYSRGRGNGFVMDTVGFIQRMYGIIFIESGAENYDVGYSLDTEFLRARTNVFTERYNCDLEESLPLIHDGMIVIVKGAGLISASQFEVFDLTYEGLFESLRTGRPVDIVFTLPESSADAASLMAIRESIRAQPLSAQYDPETATISESAVGVDFDFAGAIALINEAESGETVSIEVKLTQPEFTQEYLEGLLFRDLIGECTTRIPGTANRLNNIVLASAAVNGQVLEPGEEFSFNRIVGRRSASRGYKPAPAFSGGQTVLAYGGGICQVSSTIYSAIKDTDIRVTERYAHGKPVAYLPRGRDATVNWGTLDFKFLNNTDFPLRIDVEVVDRTLTVQVFGTLEFSDA